ncbi:unnamed protein product [Paramecium sonneborni]|uniref:MORN repeat protein n=1 Tax=Paramecium sonneborni TaxID=65129 RepID=A0A8S1RRW5_9CILI|nr:unnamed protein product [Paramecium sonneborni]
MEINKCKYKLKQYECFSGGGQYDQEGSEKKLGKWIDLDEGFKIQKQVTYNGEYNLNGMKVGRWDILFNQGDEYKQMNIIISVHIFSGGGSYGYDQEIGEKKVGNWVELIEGFSQFQQVTFNGEYNMKGIKVGKWDIMYREWDEIEYKKIGGGVYDLEGSQKKIGKWVELDENFWITYNGEYNMKGMKEGIWVQMDKWKKKKYGEEKYEN